jgi:hypothetical protein
MSLIAPAESSWSAAPWADALAAPPLFELSVLAAFVVALAVGLAGGLSLSGSI